MHLQHLWSMIVLPAMILPATAQESRVFPAPEQLLTRHNFGDIQRFREWRRDIALAIQCTIEERVAEDYDRPNGNKTQLAMIWAGEARTTELVPTLIRHIDFRVRPKTEDLLREDRYPAVRALILIGRDAASISLRALAREENIIRRENLVLVIRAVEGQHEAALLIQNTLQEEKNEKNRANLESALKLLSADSAPNK